MLKHSPFILKLEEDLKPVLAAIENRGLIMDTAKMREIISGLREKRILAETTAYDLLETSERINLNSSTELIHLLFDLNILESDRIKKRSGNFSAAKDALERIEHSAIEHIIEYRSLTRLISCLESYHQAVGMIDNRLYYKFTNYCPSGRLYTKDMSVQNLPHEGRYAIVPEDGKVFVSADYDSFELKILSALSGDRYFRKCWQEGIDLHKKVVSDMKGIPYEEVTESDRALGKVLNFGPIYGQEAFGIARKLNVSLDEAGRLIREYENKIPEIMQFKRDCIRTAKECGYAETHYGRRRELADINSPERPRREKAESHANDFWN